MSLPWKETAKRYRDCLSQTLDYFKRLSTQELEVVIAAKRFKEVSQKRPNSFVPLVGGRDINIEKAKENLFKVLENYE